MGSELSHVSGANAGVSAPARPRMVHIDLVDWGMLTLSTYDGHVFDELSDSTWVERVPLREGSVRYWSGGCHSGQINLTPAFVFTDGVWVNVMTGQVEKAHSLKMRCGLSWNPRQ